MLSPMAEFRVAMKKPDGLDYATVQAESLELEPDPIIFGGSIPRYYVLRDESGSVVARFNEKDVAGIFQGEVALDIHGTAEGDFHIGP